MSEQKRYTAQEMREEAKQCKRLGYYVAEAMLRQAADAEEANAKLRVDADLYKGAAENWERKCRSAEARLEAVVKECERQIPECRGEKGKCNPTDGGYCDENCHDEIIVHTAVTAILRAARGEGGAE